MQRQKSILSFFQKPSPTHRTAGNAKSDIPVSHLPATKAEVNISSLDSSVVRADLHAEVSGTDTPPEKVPRQILPANYAAEDKTKDHSLFFSIMHKFVKVDHDQNACERKQSDCFPNKSLRFGSNVDCNKVDQGSLINLEMNDNDVLGPETPGTVSTAAPAKRLREDSPKFSSIMDSSKRLKLLQDSTAGGIIKEDDTKMSTGSKFDWLDPSQIKDANGKRPDDPLYDRTTLYIPPEALKKMSASQKQYWSVKSKYMDIMLFFKVGKFYELYELDAEIGHKELDWKITLSGVGKCRQVGISESGIDEAIQKLVARGYKVGRIEQMETSGEAKSRGANAVIQRKLVQVVTPSTSVDNIGPDAVHLLALKEMNNEQDNGSIVYGFAFVDCADLRFWIGSINDDASCSALGALLMQVSPREVIYENRGLSKEAQKALQKYSLTGSSMLQLTPVSTTDTVKASEVGNVVRLKGYFKGSSNSFHQAVDNVGHREVTLCAIGGLIGHLSRSMLEDVLRNGDIAPYQVYKGYLKMDGQTLINLEIFSNSDDGGPSGTLYRYLDNCMTSSGKRLLRNWICHPLKDVEGINNRLNAVDDIMTHPEFMPLAGQCLHKLPDLQRLLGRVKASLNSSASFLLPMLGKKVLKQRVKVFGSLVKGLRTAIDFLMLVQKEKQVLSSLTKVFKIPLLVGNQGLNEFLTQFEAAVGSDFPNFQDHDVKESDSETLSILIELFMEKATDWFAVIHALNCIDVLRSFAVTASLSCGPMSRPVFISSSEVNVLNHETKRPILNLKSLWHPFALGENGGPPVPNDIHLGGHTDEYHPSTLLLTGPNMGGKSTLLRATCLAVIMAQLGCYVPCETCALSLVDIIFTRLGATDRIMTGESTFLIECTETASVLKNATQDSLVILDELGRGTSTFDGYAIAYAVFRHLIEKVNCRLLFATHYHPLTKEFASHPRVIQRHMVCAFKSNSESHSRYKEEIVFLYKLASGACPESYGLQVAAMAGIPKQVVKIAFEASQRMKRSIGESFKSSEQRSEFSTLHEEWLKTLLSFTYNECNSSDDDAFDVLMCLWYELKSSYR